MRRTRIDLLICLVAGSAVVGVAHAQSRATPSPSPSPKPPTVEDLQGARVLDELIGTVDQLQVLADKIVRKRHTDCLLAFGDGVFCNCLRDNLPVASSFQTYIHVITSSKDELGYAKLSRDDQKLADAIIAARETCVSSRRGKRTK